jgi:predicted aldo/keto reductase-like oxidoreductase
MQPGEKPLSAVDCYRFVLSNPDVDICMTGPSDIGQMREALSALDRGPLSPDPKQRVKAIGDYVHDNSRHLFFQ